MNNSLYNKQKDVFLPQMADSNEQLWLSALLTDDEGALRSIFDHYYAGLLQDAWRITGDTDAARDLVQDVFVELWKKRREIAVHTSLRAYLRRAVLNRALNYLKANRRTALDLPDNLQQIPDTTAADLAQQEDMEQREARVRAAIAALPEKCRIVFMLSRFEQMSHKEIAEKLNISVKTIENQITKAIKILRENLLNHPDLYALIIFLLC